jgi:hypothetical protein
MQVDANEACRTDYLGLLGAGTAALLLMSNYHRQEWSRYYATKTLITNKCTKRVLLSIVTHTYSIVPACTAVQAGTTESSRLQKQRSTQSTARSHSAVNCNLSVTITKSSP